MTIDERIDRLTERHEALAQSVELLVAENRELGHRIDKVSASVERVSATVERVSATVEQVSATVERVSKTVDVLALSVHDLVGVVRDQQTRIIRLEDQG